MGVNQPKSTARQRARASTAWIVGGVCVSLLLTLAAFAWATERSLAAAEANEPFRALSRSPAAQVSFGTELAPEIRAAVAREGDAQRGRDVYASCAVCHLDDGGGRPDGTFPQLAGQHTSVIIKQLVDIREGRRSNPLMLEFARRLSGSQEVADVARYVSGLDRPLHNGVGPGTGLEVGVALYARDCASCHGAHGEGDASRFIPALAGQHYAYMLRQIRNIGAGRRGNAHPDMMALAAGYSDAELMALVDYASRIRGGGAGE